MSFVLYAFARVGGNNKQVVGVVEVIGILLYISGSYINTQSEFDRHVWKLKEENRGRLYTEGLFSLSMHINYFGDIVLFTGLAMVMYTKMAWNREGQALNEEEIGFIVALIMGWIEWECIDFTN